MIMDYKEIEILREQLREKDRQIERFQHIIENLTKREYEEEETKEEPEPHVPTFWEKHPKVAYAVFWTCPNCCHCDFLFPSLVEVTLVRFWKFGRNDIYVFDASGLCIRFSLLDADDTSRKEVHEVIPNNSFLSYVFV